MRRIVHSVIEISTQPSCRRTTVRRCDSGQHWGGRKAIAALQIFSVFVFDQRYWQQRQRQRQQKWLCGYWNVSFWFTQIANRYISYVVFANTWIHWTKCMRRTIPIILNDAKVFESFPVKSFFFSSPFHSFQFANHHKKIYISNNVETDDR